MTQLEVGSSHAMTSPSQSQPRKKIALIDLSLDAAVPEQARFLQKYDCVEYRLTTRDQFVKDLTDGPLKNISGAVTYWDAFLEVGDLTDEVLDALPSTLKVVTIPSVGYEHVNHKGLREKNISLCNTRGLSAHAVADIALYLSLATYRFGTLFEQSLRQVKDCAHARQYALTFDPQTGLLSNEFKPDFQYAFGEAIGNGIGIRSPYGQRAAIIGFGAIGQQVGKRLQALGMDIHYYKRTPVSEKVIGYKAQYHPNLDSIFSVADLLVLAVPLTPETKHMVNKDSILKMPKGVRIVNVGRGALINEQHLLDALRAKHVTSAGLDVFEHEPKVNDELIDRLDVTLYPHIGGSTIDVWQGSTHNCLNNVDLVLSGQECPYVVN